MLRPLSAVLLMPFIGLGAGGVSAGDDFLSIAWERTIGGDGRTIHHSFERTADGGFILLASRTPDPTIFSEAEILLIKTSGNGEVAWMESFEAFFPDFGFVTEAGDGGYVFSSVAYLPGGSTDLMLTRTDARGKLLWQRTYGSPAGDDYPGMVHRDAEGGFQVLGVSSGSGAQDVFFLRTGAAGETVRETRIPERIVSASLPARDGGFILTAFPGYPALPVNLDEPIALYLIKTGAAGEVIWERNLADAPGSESQIYGRGVEIVELPGGGYLVGTIAISDAGDALPVLIRTDELGAVLWKREVGDRFHRISSANITADGGLQAAGYFSGEEPGGAGIFLARLDPSGGVIGRERRLLAAGVHRFKRVEWTGGANFAILSGKRADLYLAGVKPADGLLLPRFVRGDADGNGVLEITDAILILGHLFLGGVPPGCPDAADTNDDGSLDISDPLYGLGSLFLGAGDPPAPHPLCGRDPSADGLGVCGYDTLSCP